MRARKHFGVGSNTENESLYPHVDDNGRARIVLPVKEARFSGFKFEQRTTLQKEGSIRKHLIY